MPVLVTEEGRPLTGEDIFTFLQDQPTSQPTACVFPRGDLAASQVKMFYKKLEDVNIGVLTYGLAFHTNRSKLLRFPYCNENFYEKVSATSAVNGSDNVIQNILVQASNYILTRAEKLNDAAWKMRDESLDIATQLR